MKYISEADLRAHLINDGCDDGCGYLDERDIPSLPWIEVNDDEKQESSGDAIDRKATLAEFKRLYYDDKTVTRCAELVINGMPPVNPQPKTGHWKAKSFHELFCDNCGFDFDIMRNDFIEQMNYCPNCGAKMVEPQEREEVMK